MVVSQQPCYCILQQLLRCRLNILLRHLYASQHKVVTGIYLKVLVRIVQTPVFHTLHRQLPSAVFLHAAANLERASGTHAVLHHHRKVASSQLVYVYVQFRSQFYSKFRNVLSLLENAVVRYLRTLVYLVHSHAAHRHFFQSRIYLVYLVLRVLCVKIHTARLLPYRVSLGRFYPRSVLLPGKAQYGTSRIQTLLRSHGLTRPPVRQALVRKSRQHKPLARHVVWQILCCICLVVIGEISLVRTAHYVYLGSIAYSVRHSRQRLLALSAAAIHLQHTAVLPETQTALLHHTVQFIPVHLHLHGILSWPAVYHSTEISRQARYAQVGLHLHPVRPVVVTAKQILPVHPHLHVQCGVVSCRKVLFRTVGTQPCHNLLVRIRILFNLIQAVPLAVFEDIACR